ncbi:MAG TPA: FliI/YscN family ATPase [Planctomycetota bacterium]|nr:FliI/YscN family ATPase [Planctomycetota bacterium]
MSPTSLPALELALARVPGSARPAYRGSVVKVMGVLAEAGGLPAAIGDLCRIDRAGAPPLLAEVVGLRGDVACLMPYGSLEGVGTGASVLALGRRFDVRAGEGLLGRVLDGFGNPIDGGGALANVRPVPVHRDPPPALRRPPITRALTTGVRAIDGCLTVGLGQRIGIFAGSGVGKSTLLAEVARGAIADVAVIALVGERGREVRAFLEEALGASGLRRSVVVVATSDRPPLERYKAAFLATAIAEDFRDRGRDVVFVMDSVTRFAAACREIGLAVGEPPTVKGYPPSFFATVPRLVERAGTAEAGSITGLYTVLLDGDDIDDPVGDTLRGLLDGHVVLSRRLANRGHFPAIDVLASVSRLMPRVVDASHRELAARMRELLAVHEENRDLVQIGAYRAGTNPALDAALGRIERIETFLRQETARPEPMPQTLRGLAAAVA